jgi:hypothetical protein
LLELTFPRVGSEKSLHLTSNLIYYRSNSNTKRKKLNTLENHQKKFLEIRQQYPLVSRSRLREICSGTYRWLQINCPDWLESHLPPRITAKGRKVPSKEVDWEKRDLELAADVKASALRIRSSAEFPVRVTTRAIGRDLGKLIQLNSQLDRLPLTAKVLTDTNSL